ncbi:MAG: PucR family transcriptional regulator ligand-binding domain-containing protein [Clostridia bacterium]|nr:PucR family transcriptional regulator ligand-binding domain-containing protein [Clostridia bacterium]
MALKLKEILQMPPFKDAKVVAGGERIDNTVTGVTIMEAPDIVNWLTGGELLLTSLYSIYGDSKAQRELVLKLMEKGVSALVVKTQRFVENVSQEIIESGNELGFPVIELPGHVKFTDAMYPIMAELFNDKVSKLNYYKEVHDRFTALALTNQGFEKIISTLKELVGNPVAIYDKNYKCIASTNPEIALTCIAETDLERENLNDRFSYYRQICPKFENMDNISQVVVPIKNISQNKVYLCVTEINKKLKEMDFIPLEHAATVVSLEMLKKFAAAEVEQKYKNDLIDELLKGKIVPGDDSIYERAEIIGWNLNRPYTIMLVDFDSINDYVKYKKAKDSMLIQQIKRDLFSIVTNVANNFSNKAILGTKRNSIVILWPADTSKQEQLTQMKKLAGAIKKKINKHYDGLLAAIGIGSTAFSINELPKSYGEAKDAINFGKVIYGKEFILEFSELGVYRMICKFGDRKGLAEFMPEALNQLIEHDKNNQSEFINTLEVFLKYNGNASKAAKELFIHYKTILYRLEKIKKITNVDIEDNKVRLELELGLKILRYLNYHFV